MSEVICFYLWIGELFATWSHSFGGINGCLALIARQFNL